ncbi:MAG: BatD family protein [Candidatus Omnitrophica bacterium]|nr:BatD family protein [Candidatus Omnitrophota bacterium]MCM8793837.1 BatD family protein [Candidatus Omnitrophota bacterium]
MRTCSLKKIFLSFYPLALLFLIADGEELTLSSELNKNRVNLGEEFTFTISISGNYKLKPEIKLPDLSAFVLLSSRQSSTFNLQEKKHKTTTRYEFRLLPKKPGVFNLGPVELKYKNQIYRTKTLTIEVLPSPNLETPLPQEKPSWKTKRGIFL